MTEQDYTAQLPLPASAPTRTGHDGLTRIEEAPRMSSNTSIGRGPGSGGNENHDGDPTKTTLGETVSQERPAGAEPVVDKDAIEKAHPDGKPHKPGK